MHKVLLVLSVLAALASPGAALAQSRTTLGVGSGAVAGALVGGPIGAVAGAVVGGLVGNSTERRRRHVRRGGRPGYAGVRRPHPPRAEAALRRTARAVPHVAPAATATAWRDPR